MIFDRIENLSRYAIPRAGAIARFIAERDCAILPVGEIAIEGKELFVRVMEYRPKPAVNNKFEVHQVYMDVQYVVRGVELMQTAPTDVLVPITEYDAQGDFQFFKTKFSKEFLGILRSPAFLK